MEKRIDFAAAHPASIRIPSKDMKECMEKVLSGEGLKEIGLDFKTEELYGYSEHGGGSEARIELAKFLSRMSLTEYDPIMASFQMFLTPGSSYSLGFVTGLRKEVLKCMWNINEKNSDDDLKDVVIVEDPTYWLAKNVFEENKVELIGVELEEDGINLNHLNQILAEKKDRVKMVYVISSYQNPTGITMSKSKKLELLNLSKKHKFLILDDQVYQLLTFASDHRCPSSIFSFDYEPFSVITIGSFSKILSPGIRFGWIHCNNSEVMAMFENRPVYCSGGNLTSSITVKMLHI